MSRANLSFVVGLASTLTADEQAAAVERIRRKLEADDARDAAVRAAAEAALRGGRWNGAGRVSFDLVLPSGRKTVGYLTRSKNPARVCVFDARGSFVVSLLLSAFVPHAATDADSSEDC